MIFPQPEFEFGQPRPGAAGDNCGVSAYDVYMNSTLDATASGTGATMSGVTAATTYAFKVRARDAKGNVSGFTGDLNVTTASAALGRLEAVTS